MSPGGWNCRLDFWVKIQQIIVSFSIRPPVSTSINKGDSIMRLASILITLFLLVTVVATPVLAIEAGGKAEVLFTGVLPEDGDFEDEFMDSLDLELFLPQIGNTEFSYAFQISKPIQGLFADEEAGYFPKKLYLKHKFERMHLTLGRQPVSWSFGSLLNPVDYTLGSVALDDENNSKYTDAVEVYIPLNWNSSLSLVASFPKGFTAEEAQRKWGARARFGVKGYDLTVNYVQEAEIVEATESALGDILGSIPEQRVGFTFKGDLKDFGVYGAYGHYFEEGIESSDSYLLGADYSFNLNYNTKITFQMEYLGVELKFLEPSLRNELLKMESDDQRIDFLIGSLKYPLDDFSSISLMTMVSLDDGSLFLTPSYLTTLPGNLDLEISATFFGGKDGAIFAPGDVMPKAIIAVSLSYPF